MVHADAKKKILVLFLCLIFWGALSWLDVTVGLKVRFGPAYAIPVLLAAWYLDRGWGILSALVSTFLWHGMQMVVLHDYAITFYRYWDLLSGLVTFAAVALAASWCRGLYARETELNTELQKTLEQVKTLEGMLPICAWCRMIRDEQGAWKPIETYVSTHSDTTWTHSICPDCAQKFKDKGFS